MGQKEKEKKARRAAEAAGGTYIPPVKADAPKAPVAKRPASRPARGQAPKEPNVGSTRSTSPAGSSPPESLAAGSGNPASSGSSGRAEADSLHKWLYDEGKNGKYTCAWCGKRPYRSWFLIEATDLEGNLCVERDLEGYLYGRCYECCRGRGPHGGDDMYADLVDDNDEETLANIFRRECNKRHSKRSDVKKNDNMLLKISKFQDLLQAAMRKNPGASVSKCRQQVFDFCKVAAMEGSDAVKHDHPELYEEMKRIARQYKEMKRIQAEEGDARGIPCPYPESTGVHVQYLHKVMPYTNRFFLCRQPKCTDEGSFFGLNTDWASTANDGGWRFACPVCANPYSMSLAKTGLIPTNYIWHLEKTGQLMLAEWPETLEEKSINESAALMAEWASQKKFTELSREEVQLKIGEVVANHGFKLTSLFKKMQLSPSVIARIQHLNDTRGKGKLPYSWDHLKNGFTGAFYKYIEGVTPVMKSDQVKDYLAMVYCLIEE